MKAIKLHFENNTRYCGLSFYKVNSTHSQMSLTFWDFTEQKQREVFLELLINILTLQEEHF